MLTAEERDRRLAVERHRELLTLKVRRLQGLIDLCERVLKGEDEMSLQEFDPSAVEKQRNQYAQEARERWGGTEGLPRKRTPHRRLWRQGVGQCERGK